MDEVHRHATLRKLVRQLETLGHDTTALESLEPQLNAIERPHLLTRLTQSAVAVARKQWRHISDELQQSREMAELIRHGFAAQNKLSDEQKDKVRTQVGDLLKLVPASLIAVATASVPLPGAVLLTPTVLRRLGLMPSSWREASIVRTLRSERLKLMSSGHQTQAAGLESLCVEIEIQATIREKVQHKSSLLAHWDKNENGLWDPQEIKAYRSAIEKTRLIVDTRAHERRWYMEYEHEIYGAFRLSELLDSLDQNPSVINQTGGTVDSSRPAQACLVCFDGATGWVRLNHLLGAPLQFQDPV